MFTVNNIHDNSFDNDIGCTCFGLSDATQIGQVVLCHSYHAKLSIASTVNIIVGV